MEINKIYNMDCVDGLRELEENIIDLTITSPPYDTLRKYNNFSFDYKKVISELYRVTKIGGTVVWIVGDETKNGSESGTSMRQALYFIDSGFNLLDTMIYHKEAVGACGSIYSYNQAWEYMFIFTKGKIKTFNPIKDLVSKNAGKETRYVKTKSNRRGYLNNTIIKTSPLSSKRQNVWTYKIGISSGDDKTGHPAVFPEKLVEDHILSWSNEGDLILDPFMGSGTTAKIAKINSRNFIGFEISKEYCVIANKRLIGLT